MIDLKELGITQEELQRRVVERIAERVLSKEESDENGDSFPVESDFLNAMDKALREKIDTAVASIAEKHVHPHIEKYIDGLNFQETNRWGEPKKEPKTFREFLVQKAESYFTEEVDCDGRTRNDRGAYNWKARGTRVAVLIHKHLEIEIQNVMKSALASANSRIVEGLEKAVKMKLDEIAKDLKVTVKT